jgi:hypothetical protein
MLRYLAILLFTIISASLTGQTDSNPLRIELDARPNTEPYQIVPMGGYGMIIILKTNEFEDRNKRKWVFGYYDTIMKVQWEFIVPLLRNHEYGTYAISGKEVSLLFFDSKLSAESNVQVLTINPDQRQYNLVEASSDRRYEPFYFKRFNNHAYIGMNSRNACKIYQINLESGDLKEFEMDKSGGVYLENLNFDTHTNEIIALTSLRNERRRNALFLHRFDENGNEKSFKSLIKGENRKMVTSAEYLALNGRGYMVLGSYTSHPQRRSASISEPEGSRSTGFYKVLVQDEKNTPSVQFFSFSDLTNLENYIRGTIAERRQRSLRSWFRRSRSASFEHHLIVHRVLEDNGIYMLSGEAFTPDFRTVTTVAYDYYGRPVPRSYSVFDGYRYSHALVVAFNEQGHLLWDNGMEMINIRTFDLYPKLVLYNDSDGLALAYNHEGKIAWKQVRENTTVTNLSYANVETSYSKDRVNNEQSSRLVYWYGNYFLASGYQTITNNYLPSQNRRSVFYVNKIAFD